MRVNEFSVGYTLSDWLKAKIVVGERNRDAIKATTARLRFVEARGATKAAELLYSDTCVVNHRGDAVGECRLARPGSYAHYMERNPIASAPNS